MPYDPRNAIAQSMMQAPPPGGLPPPPGGMPPQQAGMFGMPPPPTPQVPMQPPQLGGTQSGAPGMQPPLGGLGNMAGPTPSFAGNNSSMPFSNFGQQQQPMQRQQPFGPY